MGATFSNVEGWVRHLQIPYTHEYLDNGSPFLQTKHRTSRWSYLSARDLSMGLQLILHAADEVSVQIDAMPDLFKQVADKVQEMADSSEEGTQARAPV